MKNVNVIIQLYHIFVENVFVLFVQIVKNYIIQNIIQYQLK